jgi:AcrR family transcriptional regulator
MGIAERREREKEQRRNDILDAAEKVFFSRGIKDATVDQVAEAAELSKGTLYLYFKSKEEIYLGINMRALGILRGMFDAVMASEGTGIEKVRAIGEAYYEFSQKYPDYFDAMMHFDVEGLEPLGEGSLALECHNLGIGLLVTVADAVREGIEDGTIRPDLDPMKTAILLWAQTDGVIRIIAHKCRHLGEFENMDLKDMIKDFFQFAYSALRSNGQMPTAADSPAADSGTTETQGD